MTFMTAKEMEWPMDEIAVRNSSFGEQISCRQNKILVPGRTHRDGKEEKIGSF